jgi:catechol 2,3-dioxygenase
MSPPASPISFPRFGDVAHLGHLELLTPKPAESLAFFTSVVRLHETGRSGDSVYLRGWGDYEWHTLKLTAHTSSGIGHMGLRVRDEPTLQQLVARLERDQVYGA